MVKKIRTDKSVISDNKQLPYKIINPHSHDAWIAEREFGIGASEAGKVIGCSKYGSAFDVFVSKIGLGKKVEENWAMRQGHIFEREVAMMFQKETGMSVIGINHINNCKSDWIAVSRDHDFLRVSPDYLYRLQDENKKDLAHNLKNRGVLECKTSVHHYEPECLKNECLSWFCQVQYQLHVLGMKEGYLAFLCIDTLTGGQSWFQKINYDEKFCKEILIPSLVELWESHIAPARLAMADGNEELAMSFAPEITDANDVARRYPKAEAGKTINGSDVPDLFDKISIYIQNRSAIKELEKTNKKIEDEIKLIMLDAESIVDADNKALVTYKASNPSVSFDTERFKTECKEQYDQYCRIGKASRRFLIK